MLPYFQYLLTDQVFRVNIFKNGYKGTKAQRRKGTKAQKHKSTKAQKHRGAIRQYLSS
jgi:hypothetical protein